MTASNVYPAWVKPVEKVYEDLKVDITTGLSNEEAERRRQEHGYNELEKQPATPLWKLILEQFDDHLVKILILAAGISFVLAYLEEGFESGFQAFVEPAVILLILFLNAFVGVWQESNAEAALEALKDLQSDNACVLRDGKQVADLPARELVPGDVIFLRVGDRVPADTRLVNLRTATVRIDQASLTGESVAVQKVIEPVSDEFCELQGKENMLFAGTSVSNGSCVGIVVQTGMKTEIGKIQEQLHEASLEDDDTPLKKKLNAFGELLAQVIFWICVLVWVINYNQFLTIRFKPEGGFPEISFNFTKATYYFKIAVALAVAAIPEGLPTVITTCLALGTRTMAKKNAIVRKLPSVETLGCTSVICSDKTGTLTTNQMSVVQVVALSSDARAVRTYTVSGHSYNPDEGAVQGLADYASDVAMQKIVECAAVCNEASLEFKGGLFRAVGAPTEAALLVLVEKLGLGSEAEAASFRKQRVASPEQSPMPSVKSLRTKLPVSAMLEFSRDRKSMSVISAPAGGGPNVLYVKGAAECIVERCSSILLPSGQVVPLTLEARQAVLAAIERMAEGALRCLALAYKPDLDASLGSYDGSTTHPARPLLENVAAYASIESGLTFLGLAGLQDPPRPEVGAAIAECKAAGIRVMVITGDNKKTAEAVCRSIGVFSDSSDLDQCSFSGRDFMSFPRDRQLELLRSSAALCFSRAEPRHKLDIVRLLKDLGEITAMTGDGVNDAPALKLADIGIAMGITGTEVAKEASDMILADDNFSSIVTAVAEGRSIYNNMKAFIRYMISSNIGEVASIFITSALGLPEGLIPVQLLWVNLVTDGPPATALGFNKPDPDIMTKPPRSSTENLVTPWVFFRYLLVGSYVGVATVGAFVSWYLFDNFMGIDLSADGHSTVTWQQLRGWRTCAEWAAPQHFAASGYTTAAGDVIGPFKDPCEFFDLAGKAKASTLSLSVLVVIEMLNALNALSEDNSLVRVPPWSNPWLLVAIALSISLHCVILYIPVLAQTFSIVPLNVNEWLLVLLWSVPVIFIDEVLKFLGRCHRAACERRAARDAAARSKRKTE